MKPKKVYFCKTEYGFELTNNKVKARQLDKHYYLASKKDLDDYICIVGGRGIFYNPIEIAEGIHKWHYSEDEEMSDYELMECDIIEV